MKEGKVEETKGRSCWGRKKAWRVWAQRSQGRHVSNRNRWTAMVNTAKTLSESKIKNLLICMLLNEKMWSF